MASDTDYALIGIMILSTLGLVFFIVNFLRCRNQRTDMDNDEQLDFVGYG